MRTGAGINQVRTDFVVIAATPKELHRLAGVGFTTEALAMTMHFPPAESHYHCLACIPYGAVQHGTSYTLAQPRWSRGRFVNELMDVRGPGEW